MQTPCQTARQRGLKFPSVLTGKIYLQTGAGLSLPINKAKEEAHSQQGRAHETVEVSMKLDLGRKFCPSQYNRECRKEDIVNSDSIKKQVTLLLNKEVYFLIKNFTTCSCISAHKGHTELFVFFLRKCNIQPSTKGDFLVSPIFGCRGRNKKNASPSKKISPATRLNLIMKFLETLNSMPESLCYVTAQIRLHCRGSQMLFSIASLQRFNLHSLFSHGNTISSYKNMLPVSCTSQISCQYALQTQRHLSTHSSAPVLYLTGALTIAQPTPKTIPHVVCLQNAHFNLVKYSGFSHWSRALPVALQS